MNTKVLFRLSDDEFVNEAIAELIRRVDAPNMLDVTSTEIKGTESDLESILSQLSEGVLYSNTHRRTTDVRYFNAHMDGSDYTIPSAEEPFPEDEDIYLEGEITESMLKKQDIPTDRFPDSSSTMYSKSPFYTGKPIERGWNTDRIERYKKIFTDVLFGDESCDPEHSCRCCGRSDLPNWKYNGENIDYNQTFAPLITKSGRPKSQGQAGSQKSNYRGRCVACLVAGFAYSLITKPYYTIDPGEYRIFCFRGDFISLLSIRKSYEEDVLAEVDSDYDESDPSEYSKALPSNLPSRSHSDEGQLFTILSKLNQATYSREFYSENEGSKRVIQNTTGATVYNSSSSKGGQPVRGITGVSSYLFDDSVLYCLQKVEYDSSEVLDTISYYPHQLIESLSGITDPTTESDIYPQMVGRIANGLLSKDISQVESGLFGLAKPVVGNQAVCTNSIDLLGGRKYIDMVLQNMTQLNESEMEALSSVGGSIGEIFDTRDDVSVLIGLKNSNQLDQFLNSLERAGMEAMKKSLVRGEPVPKYSAVRDDHLTTTLEVLSDEEKFDSAKKVLVTQASFSALYQNSVESSSDSNEGE
jgi:hypothetical protein